MTFSWKGVVGLSLALVIGGFAGSLVFLFFSTSISSSTSATREALASAFMGALVAFLFVRLGEALTEYYKRRIRHHDALVALQHRLNEYLDVLGTDESTCANFETVFKEPYSAAEPLRTFAFSFTPIDVDGRLPLDLLNLDLINELFSFNLQCRRVSADLQTISDAYGSLMEGCLRNRLDHQTYIFNVLRLRGDVEVVHKHIGRLGERTRDLFAKVRVLSRRDVPLLVRVFKIATRHRYPRRFSTLVASEREKLEQEISAHSEQSVKERIQPMRRDRTTDPGTAP